MNRFFVGNYVGKRSGFSNKKGIIEGRRSVVSFRTRDYKCVVDIETKKDTYLFKIIHDEKGVLFLFEASREVIDRKNFNDFAAELLGFVEKKRW